jgi:hypothetical protein
VIYVGYLVSLDSLTSRGVLPTPEAGNQTQNRYSVGYCSVIHLVKSVHS